MNQIEVTYLGALQTKLKHIKSQSEIKTDAPEDNCGKGESFSPTDLLAGSLASCILTIIGIVAERKNIDVKGANAKVTKTMGNNPRHVSKIKIELFFTKKIKINERKILEKAAYSCPVHNSLHPQINKEIIFNYSSK